MRLVAHTLVRSGSSHSSLPVVVVPERVHVGVVRAVALAVARAEVVIGTSGSGSPQSGHAWVFVVRVAAPAAIGSLGCLVRSGAAAVRHVVSPGASELYVCLTAELGLARA
jgi:hypothetical protein